MIFFGPLECCKITVVKFQPKTTHKVNDAARVPRGPQLYFLTKSTSALSPSETSQILSPVVGSYVAKVLPEAESAHSLSIKSLVNLGVGRTLGAGVAILEKKNVSSNVR